MPKLPRVTAKVFASNAAENDIGQYGSALSGTKVTTGNIEEIQALPAYETGWRGAVISDRNYPTLQEMNGLQKTFSQQIAYILENGIAEYDAGTTYYKGQICKDINSGNTYISLTDNNIGNPLTDTANWQQKYILNNKITDCILEAPNGVVSYSGSTVTVKQGLKVLFSNGLNENGSLKNIEYTLEEDLARTYTNTIENGYLFLYLNDGVIEQTWQSSNYYLIGNNNTDISSFTGVFRNNDTNITDYYTNGVASGARYICIGNNINSTNGVISSLTPFNPIDLLKKSDKSEISGWGFPSGTQIPLSLLASGEAYVAPSNGYFYISKAAGIANAYVSMYSGGIGSSASSGSASGNCVITMKCQKGNQCTIIYNATGATNIFVFVPAKGEIL